MNSVRRGLSLVHNSVVPEGCQRVCFLFTVFSTCSVDAACKSVSPVQPLELKLIKVLLNQGRL